MAKKMNQYFDDFIRMIEVSCEAARYLKICIMDFSPETLPQMREIMHQMENDADKIKHDLMARLMKEFIPPIDREDIIQMADELDNVTDKIEDVLLRIYMYNIKEIREEAGAYTEIILRCCHKLRQAVNEFPNFKRSAGLMEMLIEINSIEEEGDRLYIKAVRKLHETEKDPIAISVWAKLFEIMEECCDACEHVANVMESVIMKNS